MSIGHAPAGLGGWGPFIAACCLLTIACGKRDEPKPVPTPIPSATLGTPKPTRTLDLYAGLPTITPNLTPVKREPIPREFGGVSLGMSRKDATAKIGKLTCHQNPQAIEVCNGERQLNPSMKGFEIYIYQEKVLSIAFEDTTKSDAWSQLDTLLKMFGEPSLSGLANRDAQQRLHELYGWRDDTTLYSVRFIWEEVAPNPRKLLGTAVAIWDRKAYEAWEKDPERLKRVTPQAPPPSPPPPPGGEIPPERIPL